MLNYKVWNIYSYYFIEVIVFICLFQIHDYQIEHVFTVFRWVNTHALVSAHPAFG